MGIGVIQSYGVTALRFYKGQFYSPKCQNTSYWNGCMYNYQVVFFHGMGNPTKKPPLVVGSSLDLNRTKIPQKIVSER